MGWRKKYFIYFYAEDTASLVFSHLSLFSSPDAVGAGPAGVCLCGGRGLSHLLCGGPPSLTQLLGEGKDHQC